ncbi:uncharacterized protein LOC127859949 [Dreissena polymorpha]|uniref:Uncharacterized protein n=1 Tax=Dreissena polymorpha TaxID=45954 RepID=A0A9D4NDD1_DREPO|nr:uncharacterized protein LOC127859949 [Dreissena polymorpha]XP_052253565.1 uncharacterized protein LOC127859949 [Dreissena polymorpha]XP_052253574.1 uncharacterized protein LOC127859949 [Dreissena polymorpha]KAH3893375.1 hypothetical protein DPMN_017522 [Dreissena polymorpha]
MESESDNGIGERAIDDESMEDVDALADKEVADVFKNADDSENNDAHCVHRGQESPENCQCDSSGKRRPVLSTSQYVVIDKYSSVLAETVIHEAILINEIYDRDKMNVDVSKLKNATVRRGHTYGRTGDRGGEACSPGYDQYIIERFLHSHGDPVDGVDEAEFDGKDELYRETSYPGLDNSDAYIQNEASRSVTDEADQSSDKNNNRLPVPVIDPFSETLQTIHEDTILVIDDDIAADDSASNARQHVTSLNRHVTEPNQAANQRESDVGSRDNTEDFAKIDSIGATSLRKDDHGDYETEEEIDTGCAEDERASTINTGERVEDFEHNDEDFVDDETELTTEDEDDDEPDCCEMTFKEKTAIVQAVREGDVDLLETLLEKKNADINMTWYGENLLMVAIRSRQVEVGRFLVDNGVDRFYMHKLVDVNPNDGISMHTVDARQMAYDTELQEIVEYLDYKSNCLFPFIKPKINDFRLRQPITPFEPPSLDEAFPEMTFIEPEQILEIIADERKRRRLERIAHDLELAEMRIKARRNRETSAGSGHKHFSDSDELSQIFGPDEGYETMSPFSPLIKHDYHIPDMKQHVSIRGTKSSHMVRQFNQLKAERLRELSSDSKRINSPAKTYSGLIQPPLVLKSARGRGRFQHPHSAPQMRTHSSSFSLSNSLSEHSTTRGLPFINSEERKSTFADFKRSPNAKIRAQSAHSNISPYSHVAKLLMESRLFSPLSSATSRSSSSHLPHIRQTNNANNAINLTKTKINYIYADRSSARVPAAAINGISASDLLPRRKIRC